MTRWRVGVDAGGTFTDVCLFDETTGAVSVWKVASTPDDPSRAIAEGVEAGLGRATGPGRARARVAYFGHGTTVATNALIQHRGAPTGLVTTAGFRDLLEIGRQRRPALYDLQADKPPVLVPRDLRLEVRERVLHDGRVLTPLDERQARAAARRLRRAGVRAVAICFLYGYVTPDHEARVRHIVAEELPEAFVTASHEVAPEFREFERLSTVVVNAYLGPVMRGYLARLRPRLRDLGITAPPHLTQSNGGVISFDTAEASPVRAVLSGPASGVVGALHVGRLAGLEDLVSFDMGGTSTDVSLIQAGAPRLTGEGQCHGYPLKVPMLDIETVGAGGGSVAHVDAGGLLKVGPRSAGAAPGPACYGLGGREPTVTDANVVLQTLNPAHLLGGRMKISADAAREAVAGLAARLSLGVLETAQGIVSVVTANMARAVRVISVRRGRDPREYALVAFGGAGPLHAARLARELEIPRVLVPRAPGILCALGLLLTDLRTDHALTRLLPLEPASLDAMALAFARLERGARAWFAREGIPPARRRLARLLDMRYAGQNYELTVPVPAGPGGPKLLDRLREGFERRHAEMYGYAAPEEPIQAVTFRLEATGLVPRPALPRHPEAGPDAQGAVADRREVYLPEAGGFVACPVYDRERLAPGHRLLGPAVVEQMDATTLILPGQRASVDPYLSLLIEG